MENLIAALYVVLIEPSSSQSKIILKQFEELGISQYNYFDDPDDALDSIFSDIPDLVISSLHLEHGSGRDVVMKMRENPGTMNTPFMLISTTTSFAELNPIKQAGASAVLPKPFNANNLKRAVLNTMAWENLDHIELEDLDPEMLEVLVVDDSSLARKMITRTLSKMGIDNTSEACNGREAISLIEANHYDLIVTDFNMPEIDGHELLKYIRNESSQSSVPVIMVTTEGDAAKLAAVQHDGVSAIVDKPFEVTEVKRLIELALAPH